MLVLWDPATLEHKTVELLGSSLIPALESPDRISVLVQAFTGNPNHDLCELSYKHEISSSSQLMDLLRKTHDNGYLAHLQGCYDAWVTAGNIEEDGVVLPECFRVPTAVSNGGRQRAPPKDTFAQPGYYAFDMSSGLAKGSWTSILASANLGMHAGTHLASSSSPSSSSASSSPSSVLALCRPPGHHCTTSMAGGYCYINNVVVAVEALRAHLAPQDTSPQIAVLDLDFHHGNGTQDAFYRDADVFYLSIHGADEFPYYSGFEDEIGEGAGQAYNLNFPLPTGSSAEVYMETLETALGELERFGPEYLIVSLGFDTFHLDPLGKFQIETEDYEKIARMVRSHTGLRDVPSAILLEGGYVLDRLGANMLSFLAGWEGAETETRNRVASSAAVVEAAPAAPVPVGPTVAEHVLRAVRLRTVQQALMTPLPMYTPYGDTSPYGVMRQNMTQLSSQEMMFLRHWIQWGQ